MRGLLERHRDLTGSPRAAWILEHWADAQPRFIKVFPHEYKRVLGVPRAESVYASPINLVASGGGHRRGAAWVRSLVFLKSIASSLTRRKRGRARQRLVRNLPAVSGRKAARAGRALHGLRRSLLPHRLPGQQPHSGLERPRLQRPLGERDSPPACDEQLSRVHRPHLPCAVRSCLRAWHQSAAGLDQADRAQHC